ncbi:MAG TPA: site-specific integrase, partial [Roseiflexaceae bacterium]
YELAIWLGLREAELIGLRWEDLDLTKRTLTISGQILRRKQPDGKSKLIRQPPKSTKSARTIPLSDGLVATLRAHQARIYAERLKAGPAWRDNDLVFPTTKGTPLDRKTLVTHFKALLSAAGLPETTRFHDLRHSAASLMLDDGAQPTDVRDILGHASLQTLDKVYGHSYDEGKRRTIEAQERRLRRGAK